jgi:signal peptidase I
VFHDRGQLGCGEVGVQGDEMEPTFMRGERVFDERVAVVGQHRDGVAISRAE